MSPPREPLRPEVRAALLATLDELHNAGFLSYALGAERADGTGPQLDIFTTRETLLCPPSTDGLSARAKMYWHVLLMRGPNAQQ